MEYLDEPHLSRRLETGDPMLPAWVVHIVDQVASVLAAAHAHGIVHGQLSRRTSISRGSKGRTTSS